ALLPPGGMVLGVFRPFLVGPVDRIESALDDAQARAAVLGLEEELDGQRVVVAKNQTRAAHPAEGETPRRVHGFDLQLDRAVCLERERGLAADAQLDLRLVGEPLADLVGLGDELPDALDRRLDEDLFLTRGGDHSRLAYRNHRLRLRASIRNQSLRIGMSGGKKLMEHRIVSHAEWVEARTRHLSEEKKFTKLRDELSQARRDLPWE